MIDPRSPDYGNTPVAPQRPPFGYRPAAEVDAPGASIVTPCYNVEGWFDDTVRCVLGQSFQNFEWILVDDGSTEPRSVERLGALAAAEPRVRLIRQANAGPGAARNHGAAEARSPFLLWLDSDDLIEPTYLEKAIWCLDSHPQFAFCNAWPVGFGTQEYLWTRGFDRGRQTLTENQADGTALVRREVHLKMGGYDESIRIGHEDWEYWINMAAHGFSGYTIPEFLIWYRRRDQSRIELTDKDASRKAAFMDLIHRKHARLYEDPSRFPEPPDPDDFAPGVVTDGMPCGNRLSTGDEPGRLLMILPWLIMGGADKFNLDVVEQLVRRGWRVTIATTMPADHVWLPEFARHTPDIFCMDKFLRLVDYPRFLIHLMRSRGITNVLLSNSQLGYDLLPVLRAYAPDAAIMDYCHSETPNWKDGGYPAMAARWTDCIDLHVVSSNQLRESTARRGAPLEKIEVCHTNIDARRWDPAGYDRTALRGEWIGEGHRPGQTLLVWIGRFCEDKRPLFMLEILRRLRDDRADFVCLLAGDGEQRGMVEAYIDKHQLHEHVRLTGPLPNDRVPALLAAADVFLLPSRVEGVSLALFEAMAMETVPVSADVGGQSELVTPDVGCLVPHGDGELEVYVEALHRLITDEPHRRRLAEAARRRIVERFDLEHMGRRMHALQEQARRNHTERPAEAIPRATALQCAGLSVDRFRLERLADQLWYELQVRRTGDDVPAGITVSRARIELTHIENSRTWRVVQRIRRTLLYRLWARLVHGPDWDRQPPFVDPREKLAAIKQSRFYRMLRAVRRTPFYRVYARRRYGPDFAENWG